MSVNKKRPHSSPGSFSSRFLLIAKSTNVLYGFSTLQILTNS